MVIVETFARLLNRRIGESTAATRRLAELSGKQFAVEVTGLEQRIVLEAQEGRLVLVADADAQPDAVIKGTPLGLLRALESSTASGLRAADVELVGSVHVAEGFADVLRLARPELEAELAPWIGDIAAHEIGALFGAVRAWTGRAERALEANVAEYLQEESGFLPTATESRGFYAAVERLRDDVERAAQRLERIARNAASG